MAAVLGGLKGLVDDAESEEVSAACESRPVEIAPFRIERRLGAGAMATVYEAIDTELNRKVVLKLLQPDAFPDGTSRASLMAEARSLAALDHPHVMPLYQLAWHDDEPVLVFPRLDGRTFQEALTDGIDDWRQALGIVRDIADALAYAHSQGIVHRDIKPSNVWLRPDANGVERPLLFDFGLAGIAAPEAGTPGYRAPAGAVNDGDGKAADVFSLLVVLFVATRGIEGVPGRVNATLSRLLNAGPESRPTAAEVCREMQALLHAHIGRRRMIGTLAAISGIAALSSLAARSLFLPTRASEARSLRPVASFSGAADAPFAVSADAATFCGLDGSGNVVVERRGWIASPMFSRLGFTPRHLAVRNHTFGSLIAAASDKAVSVLDGRSGDIAASHDGIALIHGLTWSGENDATLIVLREGTLFSSSQGEDRGFSPALTEMRLWSGWSPITDGVAAIGTMSGFDTVAALLTNNTIVTWSLKKSRTEGIHRLSSEGFEDETVSPLIGWQSMDAVYVVDGRRITSFHLSPRITELLDLPSTVSSLAWLQGDVLAFVSADGPHKGHLGCILQSKPGVVLWLPQFGEPAIRVDSARNRTLLVVGIADGRTLLFDSADVRAAVVAEQPSA